MYQESLGILQGIVKKGAWPPTSLSRSRIIRSPRYINSGVETGPATVKNMSAYDGQRSQSGTFVVANEDICGGTVPKGNSLFPELPSAVFQLEKMLIEDNDLSRSLSTHCAINRNAEYVAHYDSGIAKNQSTSLMVGMGDFVGGELVIEGESHRIQYTPLQYNGWGCRHWTSPFVGERFTLNWFSPLDRGDLTSSGAEVARTRTEDAKADVLARLHDTLLPMYPPLFFRKDSTDALVIKEILDPEHGSAYDYHGDEFDFSLEGHGHVVLDIGAHIGVFTRYALSKRARHVTAYEPEPSNAAILRRNATPRIKNSGDRSVEIHESAVAQGNAGMKKLVRARNRNERTHNTWRHSLEKYSQYEDKSTNQEQLLTRYDVSTTPFFGGALRPGMSYVKMDSEGAELDILLSTEASNPDSWLDVTHLVFEWSFTKERRVNIFHEAIENLKDAGFRVTYEGQGAWWDTETNVVWPYHNDHIVFALK